LTNNASLGEDYSGSRTGEKKRREIVPKIMEDIGMGGGGTHGKEGGGENDGGGGDKKAVLSATKK